MFRYNYEPYYVNISYLLTFIFIIHPFLRGRRGRDRMVVGLTDVVNQMWSWDCGQGNLI
jgi:hypothetical protein